MRWEKIVYWICGILLLALVAYRAVILSFVHDESATISFTGDSYKNIFFGLHNFGSANNHILNTILLKWCRTHISTAEWATRLPNVLSFILYYTSLIGLAFLINKNTWTRILLITLCALDLYMLDFFSLCRGYGLANAFQMCALYFLVRDLQKGNIIVLPFVFGGIAVLANFTWLIVLAAIGCAAGIYIYLNTRGGWQDKFREVFKKCWPGLIVLAVLYLLIHHQIEHLSKQNEFKWGSNGWWDAQHTYVKNFLYTFQPPMIKFYIVQGLLVIIYILAWWTYYIKRDKMLLLALSLITSVFVITIVQRNVFDIRYINERKATLYISLTALILATLAQAWIEKPISRIISAALIMYLIIHFSFFLKLKIVAEWYYDSYTKKMMQIVAKKKPQSLGMHWYFSPSSKYYRGQLMPQDSIQFFETRDTSMPAQLDAYYLMPDDTIKVNGYDTIFKGAAGQIFLMKSGL